MRNKINTTIRNHDLIWDRYKKENTPKPGPTIENLKKIQTETIDLEQLMEYSDKKRKYDELLKLKEKVKYFPDSENRLKKIDMLLKIYNPYAKHKINTITEEDKKYLIENGESILYNDISGLYGGDQSAPYTIYYYTEVENYFEGKGTKWTANQIEEIVKSYFPDMTDEELVDYLYAMNNVGCGYVEISNTIFESYIDKPEKFEHDFGFPMYYKCDDGTFRSNVNLLFVDVYCNTYKNGLTEYSSSIHPDKMVTNYKYYPGDIDHNEGTLMSDREAILEYYKKNYGVNVSLNSIKEYWKLGDNHDDSGMTVGKVITSNAKASAYLQAMNTAISNTVKQGDNVGISASDYTLYLVDKNNNRIPTDSGLKMVDAPHAMTIVGINDNGDYIVSTWGKKYALDPMSLDTNYGAYKISIGG